MKTIMGSHPTNAAKLSNDWGPPLWPPWVTPHVLKHSVCSWLAEDGYTVDRIADMTGTDPGTVRRIYRKVNPESLSDMANSLADGLLGPESATPGRTLANSGK